MAIRGLGSASGWANRGYRLSWESLSYSGRRQFWSIGDTGMKLATPVRLAAVAHAWSWAVAAIVLLSLYQADDVNNPIAIIVLANLIVCSGLAFLSTLTGGDHRVVFGAAAISAAIAILGIASIGLLVAPIPVLLFLADHKMNRAG